MRILMGEKPTNRFNMPFPSKYLKALAGAEEDLVAMS